MASRQVVGLFASFGQGFTSTGYLGVLEDLVAGVGRQGGWVVGDESVGGWQGFGVEAGKDGLDAWGFGWEGGG